MADNVEPSNESANVPSEAMNVTPEVMAQFMTAFMNHVGNMQPQNQPNPRHELDRTALFARFRKVNPPTFNGDVSPEKAEHWIRHIKRLLETMDIQQDQDRIALATIQMEGGAEHWWSMVRDSRPVAELTWEQFEDLFLKKYFLESMRLEMA